MHNVQVGMCCYENMCKNLDEQPCSVGNEKVERAFGKALEDVDIIGGREAGGGEQVDGWWARP